jgi:hypothetical protein
MNVAHFIALAAATALPATALAKDPRQQVDANTGIYVEGGAEVTIINDSTGAYEVAASEDAGVVDSTEPHVLFGGRDSARGGWGGISTSVTSINGSAAQLVGFSGGYMIGHQFTIGIAGSGIASYVEADEDLFKSNGGGSRWDSYESDGAGHFVEGGFAGLLLQWEPLPSWVIHPNLSATLGGGAVTYSQRGDEDGWDADWDVEGEFSTEDERPVGMFSVAELRAGGTLNMTRWARLDAHLGYRYIGGMSEIDGLSREELGGLSLGVGLRFGRF